MSTVSNENESSKLSNNNNIVNKRTPKTKTKASKQATKSRFANVKHRNYDITAVFACVV